MKNYTRFLNEGKFEVGDIAYFRMSRSSDPSNYIKVRITKKGRNDEDKNGYCWEGIDKSSGRGWSKDEKNFFKTPPVAKRLFTPEDPYGEEDWGDEINVKYE